MEAVIYCIAHSEVQNHEIMLKGALAATEAYQLGYSAVVEKALPGFFLYYDAKFTPMENIITMDYPVFGLDMNLEGIDRIRQYIDAIWDEQCYLMKFPREHVIEKLRSFHSRYEKEYFNLKEIVEV